ncbi:MAG TPA: hypothetical protein VKU02_18635 [Gemmataceae bacterium]|nr:hypothetical protein [Gemmataceae bacterium]
MTYSTYLALTMATLALGTTSADADASSDRSPTLDDVLESVAARIRELVENFRRASVSPLDAAQFEKDLRATLRDQGQHLVEWTFNHSRPRHAESAVNGIAAGGAAALAGAVAAVVLRYRRRGQ